MPLADLAISIPRKYFNSPKSFIGKDVRRNCFTVVIYGRSLEAMITSSRQINTAIRLLEVHLMKRLESDFACMKLKCNREVDNLENHCLDRFLF